MIADLKPGQTLWVVAVLQRRMEVIGLPKMAEIDPSRAGGMVGVLPVYESEEAARAKHPRAQVLNFEVPTE